MPSKKNRKEAIRSAAFLVTAGLIGRGKSYEARDGLSLAYDYAANRGREKSGAFMRQADKARLRTAARQVRHNASNGGNEYRQGTKEEVNAQHKARYRDIRRAFGMSAG